MKTSLTVTVHSEFSRVTSPISLYMCEALISFFSNIISFCLALSLARQRVLWERKLSYGVSYLPTSGPKSVPAHMVNTGYLLRECLGPNPVRCWVHWKTKIHTWCWGHTLRQKEMVKSLFGLLWSTPGWTVWMIKNSCFKVSNAWVLVPAQSLSTCMALEESSDVPEPQFSCSIEWVCQSLHQMIAVKIWWSDECRLPWTAQLMCIRTWINAVLYVFWVGHSGSLVILLSHTYPSSFLHHSPRITLLCLYQYSSHKYALFQVHNLLVFTSLNPFSQCYILNMFYVTQVFPQNFPFMQHNCLNKAPIITHLGSL